MPTSDPGNSARRAHRAGADQGRHRAGGFTLLEMLMVVVLVALLSSLVAVSMRDPAQAQLQQEATRLAALLEGARAESRAVGTAVRFEIAAPGSGQDFRFIGLPGREPPPTRWLSAEVQAEIVGAAALRLGPEPLIGPQRIRLRIGDQQIALATDGLGPFSIQDASP
ncbi:MAG: prepilin-type N-terminal cleavage/methylation domain-containing protein [Aquabacterium sp.]